MARGISNTPVVGIINKAFVALMNTRGFTTLPRLLHERLTGRPR